MTEHDRLTWSRLLAVTDLSQVTPALVQDLQTLARQALASADAKTAAPKTGVAPDGLPVRK
jgi:hypothetical protein